MSSNSSLEFAQQLQQYSPELVVFSRLVGRLVEVALLVYSDMAQRTHPDVELRTIRADGARVPAAELCEYLLERNMFIE
ncbi:hypothetical protein CVT26_007509 [Gymnopilus dilepis]|uniref:Uncharacterized protein n=1 Tax=Gymnopilus dilepis TaxID=231916 RepID=A0A409YSQ3_9AGAR|nr:hypothetical protein CVT26_007509 [Gymnopilus dilepis]